MPGTHTTASLRQPFACVKLARGAPTFRHNAPLIRTRSGVGGLGFVSGTVKIYGTPNTPVSRRVLLLSEVGVLLSSTMSNPLTGAFRFDGLNPGARYMVVTTDHTGTYEAVAANNLKPEIT
jgi:hypothetical protein